MVCCRLTRIERNIIKLQEKEGLTPSDLRKIKCLKELAKEHDRDVEHRCLEVLNFIEAEDKVSLDLEEAVFDEHVNHVSDIIKQLEQLEDLVATTEPVMPRASGKGSGGPEVRSITEVERLSRRLSLVHDSLMKVESCGREGNGHVRVRGHEERLKSTNSDLQGIKHDMLVIYDYESLAGKAGGLEEASFKLRVTIKHLLKNIKTFSK